MKQSETIGELAKALAKAQGDMAAASKDSKSDGPSKHTYADLDAVWEAIRVPLSANGLAVTQGLSSELHTLADGSVWGWMLHCETRLIHSSGEWQTETLILPVVEQRGSSMVQSIGSAGTYARRYGLTSMVGITQADDDGHVGQKRAPKETKVAKDARQAGHHKSWDEDRARFCAAIREMGWSLDQVKAAIEKAKPGGKKPSEMTTPQRQKLFEMIHGQAEPFGVTR